MIEIGYKKLESVPGWVIKYDGELVSINVNTMSKKIWKDKSWAQKALDKRIASVKSFIEREITNDFYTYQEELSMLQKCAISEVDK